MRGQSQRGTLPVHALGYVNPTIYRLALERETEVFGDSVLVCLKPKSVVAESDNSVGVKDLFVCVKQT